MSLNLHSQLCALPVMFLLHCLHLLLMLLHTVVMLLNQLSDLDIFLKELLMLLTNDIFVLETLTFFVLVGLLVILQCVLEVLNLNAQTLRYIVIDHHLVLLVTGELSLNLDNFFIFRLDHAQCLFPEILLHYMHLLLEIFVDFLKVLRDRLWYPTDKHIGILALLVLELHVLDLLEVHFGLGL